MKNRIERLIKAKMFPKRTESGKSKRVPKENELALGTGPEGAVPSKEFKIEEILSVTTGVLMIPKDKFGKIADLLEYMEGASIVRHCATSKDALSRLSLAADDCKGWLNELYPWLGKVKIPKGDIKAWIEALKVTHGEKLEIKPKPMSKVGWTPPNEIFWEEPSK